MPKLRSRNHQWIVEVGGDQQFDSNGRGYFSDKDEAADFAGTFVAADDHDADPLDYVRAAEDHYASTNDAVRNAKSR